MAKVLFAVIVILVILSLPAAGEVATLPAVSIPMVEWPCGDAMHHWRCFRTTGDTTLTTTFNQPDGDWTITPILPDDPENWRLINVGVGFSGSIDYGFVFPPAPLAPGTGALLAATFVDSEGRTLLTASRQLEGFCRVATAGLYVGKWICSDGESFYAEANFGEIGDIQPLDPNLPSLNGPITIHVDWTLFATDVPEWSSMNVRTAFFGYIFERNACDDEVDNDADGLIDYPADPGCASSFSTVENPACDDGVDNDGDGKKDYPLDGGCSRSSDVSEQFDCLDGFDNDADGRTDYPADPGCARPEAPIENPECNDGIDNDGDALVDLSDPQCSGTAANPRERSGCGLGPELGLVMAAVFAVRRTRIVRRA